MFSNLKLLQTLFKTLAISFSTMTLFTGITPLYGSSLLYAGPATLVWGWVVVSFFTWFVGIAMAEICSSFPVCLLLLSPQFPATVFLVFISCLNCVSLIQYSWLTDNWFSVFLGCAFSWSQMGSFCIMVLCLA